MIKLQNVIICISVQKNETEIKFYTAQQPSFCEDREPISVGVNGMFATKMFYSDLIHDQVKPKTAKIDIHSSQCLMFCNEMDSANCEVSTVCHRLDRLAGGSFTRGPNGLFAVFWPRQLDRE